MDNLHRPSTIPAVEAALRERVEHSRIDAADITGRYAYMFGMACALLAEANREIARLARHVAERDTESPDDDEPCLADGTPRFPARKLTRQERLEGLADRGYDTTDELRGER